jgi:hypothetical protein
MVRHTFACIAVFVVGAVAACGGKVEDFRTDGAGASPTASADAASSADGSVPPAFPRVDGGACRFFPATVRLTPHPHNEPPCQAPVECRSLTGHGAMFLHCSSGVGSEEPVFTEQCDASTCSCVDPKAGVGVFFDAPRWAYGLAGLSRFCSYSVEVIPTSP